MEEAKNELMRRTCEIYNLPHRSEIPLKKTGLYFVTKGCVYLYKIDEFCNEILYNKVEEGSSVIICDGMNDDGDMYVRAVYDTQLSYFSESTFNNDIMLMKYYVSELKKFTEFITIKTGIMHKKSAKHKLLGYVDYMVKTNKTQTIYIPFDLTRLSSYLNIDRTTLNRTFDKLKEEGLMIRKGRYIKVLY